MGGDLITTGSGTHTIIGDNGVAQKDVEGNNFALVKTKSQASAGGGVTDLGGDAPIVTGDGDKRILGGDGADTIQAGNGNHLVMGDNGSITYVGMDLPGEGRPQLFETTDTLALTGGNDLITVGNAIGESFLLGGMGADSITTGSGTHTIIGDNGIAQKDAQGDKFVQVRTKSQASAGGGVTDLGGNDTIVTGDGDKRTLGGEGADTITAGAGTHVVAGDNAQGDYKTAGLAVLYPTTHTTTTTGEAHR